MPGSLSPRLQPQELDLEVFIYTLVYENDDGEAQGIDLGIGIGIGQALLLERAGAAGSVHETWVSWNDLRKYGLAFMLVGFIETEARRMSEERKLVDSNERRLETARWMFGKIDYSFYAKREFTIRGRCNGDQV